MLGQFYGATNALVKTILFQTLQLFIFQLLGVEPGDDDEDKKTSAASAGSGGGADEKPSDGSNTGLLGREQAGLFASDRFRTGFRLVSCRMHNPCHSVNSLELDINS